MVLTFSSSPFAQRAKISIPDDVRLIFVADAFSDQLLGGAELTSEALMACAPFQVLRVQSRDVDLDLLERGSKCHWIFGNFSTLDFKLIPTIVGNISYSILEYDYKYCKYRSPEKHMALEGAPCDCHNKPIGKYVSAFFLAAKMLWWMSEAQQERYHTLFPFLIDRDQMVLSSVFSHETLKQIEHLRTSFHESGAERDGWVRLESSSWVKGSDAAKAWCESRNLKQLPISSLPYHEVLKLLSTAEGLVYLPAGGDTCPRLVIEAKLLGCKLHLNENVQHSKEEWFATDDLEAIEDYLANAPSVFWTAIKRAIEYRPSISGYTTTLNCITQEYPFEHCIRSMQGFCDQIVIVDGGSTDGTWEALQALEREDPARILAVQAPRDWSHPSFALFDGQQKAHARSLCKGDFCWQMDCDEVVHEEDCSKIRNLAAEIPRGVEIVSLPVIEFWSNAGKVRVDVPPWKWRLSRNSARITHGVPKHLRTVDSSGNPRALQGTDGCDMIYADTGEHVPHVSFYTADVDVLRQRALNGDVAALAAYENWFNSVVEVLPSVFHFSWFDLERKIKLYRDYWTRHWQSLYGENVPDTGESNMMFDVPWSAVTDSMISDRARLMSERLGGWVWHRKWDGEVTTPSIRVVRDQPAHSKENS